jgi:hypothetical protein
MSAKKLASVASFGQPVSVSGRDTQLELSTESVSVHKSGIEFRSPTPFTEWSEMTVALQSPLDGSKVSCNGVVVACVGNKHSGYHISMIFTGMTRLAQERLNILARSELGAG